ncbi:phospho-N-acetylmuramoyl-pentapeptide-transferase [soil metagenome]
MRLILIAVGISLTVSILLTPVLIRLFTRQGFGHEIREDGPPSHKTKRGTPSMGGVAILAGIWAAYLGTHLVGAALDSDAPSATGLLVLGLATALGAVGFLDDLIKIRRSRNLGLNKTAKTVGQLTAAVLFGVLILGFRNSDGLTPGSPELSYVREIATVTLAPALFVLFVVVVVSAWSNAVNFTDGLDALAGSTGMVAFVAYGIIAYIQGQVGVVTFSFIMVGALALGAGLATAALMTGQWVLLPIVGLVFVAEALSVVIQVAYFRRTGGRRFFRRSPIHYHFLLLGWSESQVTMRFLLVGVMAGLFGVALALL